jgi:hypothetical protein
VARIPRQQPRLGQCYRSKPFVRFAPGNSARRSAGPSGPSWSAVLSGVANCRSSSVNYTALRPLCVPRAQGSAARSIAVILSR